MEEKIKTKLQEIHEHKKKLLDVIPILDETIEVFRRYRYFRRVDYFTTCICGKKSEVKSLFPFAVFVCSSCGTIYRFVPIETYFDDSKIIKVGTLQRIEHLPFTDHLWKEEYKVEIIPL